MPFEFFVSTVRVIQLHVEPIAIQMFALSNRSASRLEFTLALMSGEKFMVPQIENGTTAFPQAHCESAKHIAICCRIEITKALRHDNRHIERVGRWPVLANVRVDVAWAASQFARLRDGISIAVDADYRVTLAGKRAGVSSHAATDIGKFAEVRQRGTTADKSRFLNRTCVADSDMKKLEPSTRISIGFCAHSCSGGL